jgi:hypothetical protein
MGAKRRRTIGFVFANKENSGDPMDNPAATPHLVDDLLLLNNFS